MKNKHKGFTLLELMVIVSVFGILVSGFSKYHFECHKTYKRAKDISIAAELLNEIANTLENTKEHEKDVLERYQKDERLDNLHDSKLTYEVKEFNPRLKRIIINLEYYNLFRKLNKMTIEVIKRG